MSLRDALAAGEFVVTAELGPPVNPDPELVRRTARAFAGKVHAANVTDNQAATVKLSPLACSVWMLEEGLEPILQLTTRDRNLLALQSDLLGAWALGVGAVLALSGDPLKVGPYEPLATRVGDLDSGRLRLVALEILHPGEGGLVDLDARDVVVHVAEHPRAPRRRDTDEERSARRDARRGDRREPLGEAVDVVDDVGLEEVGAGIELRLELLDRVDKRIGGARDQERGRQVERLAGREPPRVQLRDEADQAG